MFNVDWLRLIILNVLSELRKQKNLDWMQALINPVTVLHDEFIIFIDDIFFKSKFTAQIISLTHILNETFDIAARGIFISDVITFDQLFIHRRIEAKPKVFLYRRSEGKPKRFLRRRSEFIGEFDYIVNVPAAVAFDVDEMTALIKLYNISPKRFQIVIF